MLISHCSCYPDSDAVWVQLLQILHKPALAGQMWYMQNALPPWLSKPATHADAKKDKADGMVRLKFLVISLIFHC